MLYIYAISSFGNFENYCRMFADFDAPLQSRETFLQLWRRSFSHKKLRFFTQVDFYFKIFYLTACKVPVMN